MSLNTTKEPEPVIFESSIKYSTIPNSSNIEGLGQMSIIFPNPNLIPYDTRIIEIITSTPYGSENIITKYGNTDFRLGTMMGTKRN